MVSCIFKIGLFLLFISAVSSQYMYKFAEEEDLNSLFGTIYSNISYAYPGCQEPMGMEDGSIKNYQISTSTHYPGLTSEEGRLNSKKSWSSLYLDKKQYYQVDFLERQTVTIILTKGRENFPQWVTAYQVAYSHDGIRWETVKNEQGAPAEFVGNTDHKTTAMNVLPSPINSRFIRVIPLTYHGWISMRLEFVGCYNKLDCKEPMGLASGLVADSQITASSIYGYLWTTSHARLDDPYSWSALYLNGKQYLMVDFLETRAISGIITKGRGNLAQWVKKFKVMISRDSINWNPVTNSQGNAIFEGNKDQHSAVINLFDRPVRARMIKIIPVEWTNWISMRIEILGCYQYRQICDDPMGMENNLIKDYQLSASSIYSDDVRVENARINSSSAWSPSISDSNQYIIVDFLETRTISGIITRGSGSKTIQWVKAYRVDYSIDGVNWISAVSKAGLLDFIANTDKDTQVANYFSENIEGRYIKIIPTRWFGYISLRFEILGCLKNYECMESLDISDKSAAILSGNDYYPSSDPIDSYLIELNSINAWTWNGAIANPFIQVNFHKPTIVTAVITKGRAGANEWVSAFQFEFSADGDTWMAIKDNFNNLKEYAANADDTNPAMNFLPQMGAVRSIRIKPTEHSNSLSIRIGFLGCTLEGWSAEEMAYENNNVYF